MTANRKKHAARRIGYARVSTVEQNIDMQRIALAQAGCDNIHIDHGISGTRSDRPGLNEALVNLQRGDTLVVWRLDRLGRSLLHLIRLIMTLTEKGVHFHSITENIDTTSAGGKLIFHMMASLAEFERTLISERTKAGLAARQQMGARLGRPPALSDEQKSHIADDVRSGRMTGRDAAAHYRVSVRTIRRVVRAYGGKENKSGHPQKTETGSCENTKSTERSKKMSAQ